jgi:hypothetical protein
MKEIVINTRYGGFSLSRRAIEYARQKGYRWALECPIYAGEKYTDGSVYDGTFNNTFFPDVSRDNPELIEVVKTLGTKANGDSASLKIVEIPDDAKDWYIDEYDGKEVIREGRVWD